MLKILWYSDLHLNTSFPWSKYKFYQSLNEEKPDGIFITGDLTTGLTLKYDLTQLAKHIKCPIYFVLGNHEMFWTGINYAHKTVQELCKKYSNLYWLDQESVIKLDEHTGVVGTMGWGDLSLGKHEYIKYTTDWFVIPEFRKLPNMESRKNKYREMAEIATETICNKIIEGFKTLDTIYCLTHFPAFEQATVAGKGLFKDLWLAYDICFRMGEALKNLMKEYKKKNLIVLSGHHHYKGYAHIRRNLMAFTAEASYIRIPKPENFIVI